MNDQKRGRDADDAAPKPNQDTQAPAAAKTKRDAQDGANYDERTDKGKAIAVENVSSANDE